MEMDYALILALFGVAMMLVLREVNDIIFIYYQHLALPLSMPMP